MRTKIYIIILLVCVLLFMISSTMIVYNMSYEDKTLQKIEYINNEIGTEPLVKKSEKWVKLNYNALEETLVYNFKNLGYTVKDKFDDLDEKSALFRMIKKIAVRSIKDTKKSIKESMAQKTDKIDDKHNV